MTKTLVLLITVSAFLSGCVTTPERPSEIPIAANSDKHARFEDGRVYREANDLLLTGWVRASPGIRNNFYKPGTIHIEIVGQDGAPTVVDVPWRPNRVGRVRRLMPKRISVKLPSQASGASLVRVSHGHPGHSDTPGAPQ
jgi:hypothetical protein